MNKGMDYDGVLPEYFTNFKRQRNMIKGKNEVAEKEQGIGAKVLWMPNSGKEDSDGGKIYNFVRAKIIKLKDMVDKYRN